MNLLKKTFRIAPDVQDHIDEIKERYRFATENEAVQYSLVHYMDTVQMLSQAEKRASDLARQLQSMRGHVRSYLHAQKLLADIASTLDGIPARRHDEEE